MCLMLTITLSKDDLVSKETLQNWVQPNSKVEFQLVKSIFSRNGNVLRLGEVGQGCACSLLTDEADWNSSYWDMLPEFLPDLAQLVKLLRQYTKHGFAFQAQWIGEVPSEQMAISIEEMAQIIENGKISPRAKYLIA